MLLKSSLPIPPVARFRYFEVEVLENKVDANIFVGIIEQGDPFNTRVGAIEELNGL